MAFQRGQCDAFSAVALLTSLMTEVELASNVERSHISPLTSTSPSKFCLSSWSVHDVFRSNVITLRYNIQVYMSIVEHNVRLTMFYYLSDMLGRAHVRYSKSPPMKDRGHIFRSLDSLACWLSSSECYERISMTLLERRSTRDMDQSIKFYRSYCIRIVSRNSGPEI